MSLIDFKIDEISFVNFSDPFQRIHIYLMRKGLFLEPSVDNFYISIHKDVTYNQLLHFLILRYEDIYLSNISSYQLRVNGWMYVINYEERIGSRFHFYIHLIY